MAIDVKRALQPRPYERSATSGLPVLSGNSGPLAGFFENRRERKKIQRIESQSNAETVALVVRAKEVVARDNIHGQQKVALGLQHKETQTQLRTIAIETVQSGVAATSQAIQLGQENCQKAVKERSAGVREVQQRLSSGEYSEEEASVEQEVLDNALNQKLALEQKSVSRIQEFVDRQEQELFEGMSRAAGADRDPQGW